MLVKGDYRLLMLNPDMAEKYEVSTVEVGEFIKKKNELLIFKLEENGVEIEIDKWQLF